MDNYHFCQIQLDQFHHGKCNLLINKKQSISWKKSIPGIFSHRHAGSTMLKADTRSFFRLLNFPAPSAPEPKCLRFYGEIIPIREETAPLTAMIFSLQPCCSEIVLIQSLISEPAAPHDREGLLNDYVDLKPVMIRSWKKPAAVFTRRFSVS
ncbi:MAG: hypothetical protein D6820_02195 [Lentisphaerae bacterium]|nr:MAG: hypothetical protein D6820_02195 [Lentisphaerota bacterium]